MMHAVGRRGAVRGLQRSVRRAHSGGDALQRRAFHFRARSAGGERAFGSEATSGRDVASAAAYFLDATAACKNKRCALGKDHSGIVSNPAACGEDSFFLSKHIVGVADGVGGWNENGVDPGEISRCLMRNAAQFVRRHEQLQSDVSTLQVLSYGFEQAQNDDAVEAGSTTACIVKIAEAADGTAVLEYTNLGDSGFAIIRDGKVVFRSKFQYYGRAPYQLAKVPLRFKHYGAIENQPSDADSGEVAVEDGDIIVLATDGVWDNFSPDLEASRAFQPPMRSWRSYWHGDIASLVDVVAADPAKAAENIVLASLRHNLKPDDITVVVAKVVRLAPKL